MIALLLGLLILIVGGGILAAVIWLSGRHPLMLGAIFLLAFSYALGSFVLDVYQNDTGVDRPATQVHCPGG